MRSKKINARSPRSARAARTRNQTARKPHARSARRKRHVSDDETRPSAVPAAVSIYAASRSIASAERPRLTLHTKPDDELGDDAPGRSSRLGPWSLAGSAACVLVVLFLVGAPTPPRVDTESTEPAEVPTVTVSSPRTLPQAPRVKDPAVRLEVKKPEAPATLPLSRVAPETHPPMPVVLASVPPSLPKLMAAAEPASAVHAAPAPAPVVDPSVFTVTGCLDVNKDGFRLNNTEGENVPQSRSWKSGFLRKRSATILLEDTGRVGLGAHVGELVTLTGKLEDRDMQVRSLRRVAASCEN